MIPLAATPTVESVSSARRRSSVAVTGRKRRGRSSSTESDVAKVVSATQSREPSNRDSMSVDPPPAILVPPSPPAGTRALRRTCVPPLFHGLAILSFFVLLCAHCMFRAARRGRSAGAELLVVPMANIDASRVRVPLLPSPPSASGSGLIQPRTRSSPAVDSNATSAPVDSASALGAPSALCVQSLRPHMDATLGPSIARAALRRPCYSFEAVARTAARALRMSVTVHVDAGSRLRAQAGSDLQAVHRPPPPRQSMRWPCDRTACGWLQEGQEATSTCSTRVGVSIRGPAAAAAFCMSHMCWGIRDGLARFNSARWHPTCC
jgi:hypothetical protein